MVQRTPGWGRRARRKGRGKGKGRGGVWWEKACLEGATGDALPWSHGGGGPAGVLGGRARGRPPCWGPRALGEESPDLEREAALAPSAPPRRPSPRGRDAGEGGARKGGAAGRGAGGEPAGEGAARAAGERRGRAGGGGFEKRPARRGRRRGPYPWRGVPRTGRRARRGRTVPPGARGAAWTPAPRPLGPAGGRVLLQGEAAQAGGGAEVDRRPVRRVLLPPPPAPAAWPAGGPVLPPPVPVLPVPVSGSIPPAVDPTRAPPQLPRRLPRDGPQARAAQPPPTGGPRPRPFASPVPTQACEGGTRRKASKVWVRTGRHSPPLGADPVPRGPSRPSRPSG